MTTLEIIELSLLGVAILALVVYIIVKGVKSKWFEKLFETVTSSIKEAEKLYPDSGSGEKKKEYVINKVEAKCKELGIPYTLLKKLIDVAIDKIVNDYNILVK